MPYNRRSPISQLTQPLTTPGARWLLLLALLAAALTIVHMTTAAPSSQPSNAGSREDELTPAQVSMLAPPETIAPQAPTATTFSIMQMNPDSGELANTTYSTTFDLEPAGYTFARHFTVAGKAYLLLLPSQSGYAVIHAVLPGGQLGDQVDSYHWEPRWSAADFVTIGANTYLFLHDAYAGLVRTYQMQDNGTIDPASRTDATHEDWQDKYLFAPYQHGANWYLLGLNTWTGDRTSYTVGGNLVSNGLWTRGWTSVDNATFNGVPYQLLHKAAGDPTVAPGGSGDELGRLLVRSITAESGTDESLYDGDGGAGWSHVRFVRSWGNQGEHLSIFFYNRDSGAYRVRAFDEQTGSGPITFQGNIGAGWTDLEPYVMGFQTYIIAMNEEASEPFYYDEAETMAQCIHNELQDQVVGYQFGVIQSGQTIYSRAWGVSRISPSQIPMTTRTRTNIGSVSKMITTMNVLKLADMGEIDLDNPIGNYLDTAKYPPAVLDDWVKSFTLVNLLTHTTGASQGCTGTMTTGLDCTQFYSTPSTCTPGTCPNVYVNSNIGALRDVVEWFSVTTVPDDYVATTHTLWGEHIGVEEMSCTGDPDVFNFAPCTGANCVAYNGRQWQQGQFIDGDGNVNASAGCASGGWYASSQHMMQFLAAMDYGKVLSPEYNERLLDTSLTDGNGNPAALGWGTGAGVFTAPYWTYPSGVRNLQKNGDLIDDGVGLRTVITRLPDNAAAVLLVNSSGSGTLNNLMQGAYRFATGGQNSCPNY